MVSLAVAAACTKGRAPAGEKAKDSSASADSASLQAKWDEMVPKPDEGRKLPASWTDPKVVAALAERCDYAPARPLPPNVGDISLNRFLCRLGPTLSTRDAGRDPCAPYADACEAKCAGACTSCDDVCVGACKACVQPCADGDCKKSCATSCAVCKEACTTTWEACTAGACSKEHDACTARLTASWAKNGCAKRCEAYGECAARCSGPDPGRCLAKCTAAVAPALPACLDKCAYVASPAHEMCEVKCYETAPCAPALCRDPPPSP